MSVPRGQRLASLRQTRSFKRHRMRAQIRQARRVLSLVRARKAQIIAVVGGAIVVLIALGAGAAVLVRRLVAG
jgi:hypothetical protein